MAEHENAEEAEIRDTDIVFDCPHCGKNLVIDYRGAGLQINCSECGEPVLVPIPDGMQLGDLDLDPGEILKQLFATRRNYQKAEAQVESLKARLVQLQETIGVMQEVVAEGLSES
jgi:predicted  nucleic acid-binding Zn-ribbon protein